MISIYIVGSAEDVAENSIISVKGYVYGQSRLTNSAGDSSSGIAFVGFKEWKNPRQDIFDAWTWDYLKNFFETVEENQSDYQRRAEKSCAKGENLYVFFEKVLHADCLLS